MSWKKSFIFAILQLATINSLQPPSSIDFDHQKIRDDIYNSIYTHDRFLWSQNSLLQNIQFIPLSAEISLNIFQLKYYFESGIQPYYPKDTYLGPSYTFARIVDTLQNSSDVKLKVNTVMFYDEKNTTQQFLDDVKTYYHAEVYKSSFDPKDNETVLTTINEWISNKTNGRARKLNTLNMSGKTYLQVSTTSYVACWDTPKTFINSEFQFKTLIETITVDAITSKEKIGYYDNAELKYEAIKLPYKNGEFAMAIVLPYQNYQSLQLFRKLDNWNEYAHLFQQIDTHEENVHYIVPSMNLSYMVLNENGTSVNGNDPIACNDSSSIQATSNDTHYTPFFVDRPYALFIYHTKTKFVLIHALVRNPTSNSSGLNDLGRKSSADVLLVQSSNLYEFFHMLG